MSKEVTNFLNNLSEEQLDTLKQLLNKENPNDKTTTKTEKDQEATAKTEKRKQEAQQRTEVDQEKAINQKTTTNVKEKTTINKDFTVTRNASQTNRKVPVRYKKNEWEDVGEHQEIDTPRFEKTPRNRTKPNKEEVECHICGKVFTINSSLVYGEYQRCNKCTGR